MQPTVITKGIIWFILWTGFSFLAHFYARKTILAGPKDKWIDEWVTLSILTLVQTLLGGFVLKLVILAGDRGFISGYGDTPVAHHKSNGRVVETDQVEPCETSLYTSHCTATLSTNASIAFVNTGSAFTIKAFEPISTAVLNSMLLGTKLQNHVIISLPLVVSGALGFVWQPSLRSDATFGLSMAFVSNVLFGIRNINLKQFHTEMKTMKSQLHLLMVMSFKAAACTAAITAGLIAASQRIPIEFSLLNSIFSGIFHITYTIVSTCIILSYTSVVGHATCNLLKRILVAATFFIIGQAIITPTNWMMGGIMVIGLVIYIFPEKLNLKVMNPSISLISVVTLVVLLLACLAPKLSSDRNIVSGQSPDTDNSQSLMQNGLSENIIARENALTNSKSRNAATISEKIQSLDFIKDPITANKMSIQATTTNDLIQEAYNIHQTIFNHIIGKYKKAVLVNVFQWFNKGDHLITIGQRKILQRMGIELIYHCYYPGHNCDFKLANGVDINVDDPELVVLIQGAGYIGHPSHELVIDKTLTHFPSRRVMVFPISVCHPIQPCTEMLQFNEIFQKHKDVHLVLRDRYSYDLSEQYFKTTHNYLAPDSAFAVGSIRLNIVPVYDIIWLKRNDWESQTDPMPKIPDGVTVQIQDWEEGWMKQTSENFWEDHQLRTMTGISFLARGKVIVSDRLHAHIMSQLMGKLNVVINSQTKKQEHYYKTWEQSVKTSALVNNNEEALNAALKLLEMYDETVTIV